MLGSDYRELIVPRLDQPNKPIITLIGGGIAVAVCIVLLFLTHSLLLLLVAAAVGFGTWYFWRQAQVEYEYVIFGDEVRITKIIAQSKRKEMLVTSLARFTAFGNLSDAPQPAPGQTLVQACALQDSSAYYADFSHESYGQTRLLFTPDASILEYLSNHLPRSLGFRYIPPADTEIN